MITFRFLMNESQVPQTAVYGRKSAPVAETERKSYTERKPIVPSTANCSLDRLNLAGYELVDAFCHPRPVSQNQKANFVVLFRFALKGNGQVSDEFAKVRPELLQDFLSLCQRAFWQLDVHANPYFQDGVPVDGQLAVSVNLNQRVPRFKPNGEPEVKWHRDGEGEKVGDGPVPVWPDYLFLMQDTGLPMLEPVEE